MKRTLVLVLIAIYVSLFSAALDYKKVESLYRNYVEDFLSGGGDEYVSYVKSQLPYMSLYRFYKIKMVGSIDRREAALTSSNFLAALIEKDVSSIESISDLWEEKSIYEFWKIEDLCGGEEEESGFGFLGGFGFGGGTQENGEEKLKECIEKIIEEYGTPPKAEKKVDFNILFSKALFLAYLEAYLKHTNPTPSSVMASIPLSLVYSKYARYVTSEMKKAVKHALLYYSGMIDEPLPFEIEGLKVERCERCGKFSYKDQDKLSMIDRDYSYKGLSLEEVLSQAVKMLSKMSFKDEEDFNWKIRMVAFFVYDDMVKKNLLGKPIYKNLRDNMIDILSHTLAYYLGATQTEPPIKLKVQRVVVNPDFKYEMFRYSAVEDLEKLFKNEKVIGVLRDSLERMRMGGLKDFEKFSNDVADRVIEVLGLEDTKQDLATIASKAAPKRINLWWIRYLVYAVIVYLGWKTGKLREALILSVVIEIAYIAIFMDPISLGEGLLYSLLAFFTFAFSVLLSLSKFKKSWPLLIFALLYVILIFVPEYPAPKNLSMDENSGVLRSEFAPLLINDLYDGEKYREFLKNPAVGFFADSELGRTIDKLLSEKDPLKSRLFKKARRLTEKIAKYSNDELRRDFLDFLKVRISKEDLRNALSDVVKAYIGKPATPPPVENSQTFKGLKAFVIFALVYFLFTVELRSVSLGVVSLVAGIYLIFGSDFFVELGVPKLQVSGLGIPYIQVLLIVFSIFIISKSLRGRVRA